MLLRIHNLGETGAVIDLEPVDLPPGAITYGENYKVINNKVTSAYFNRLLVLQTITQNCGHVFWVPGTNFYMTLARAKATVYNGTTWSDVTETGGYAGIAAGQETLWVHCMIGNIPVVNNPQTWPAYWSPQQVGTLLQPLKFNPGNTWKALNYHANVVRSHNNFLFALNLTEGATVYPTSYRWSHPADVNGLPFTWDETDLSAIAGKASIGVGGDIVDGLSMRDSFVIYSESAITILSYTGGEFVWSSRTLTSSYGLLATDCVVEVGGIHYFMTAGDIMANNGNSIESILSRRIKTRFVSGMSPDHYANSFAVVNPITKEIWFCYPEVGFEFATIAIVFNYEFNTLSSRALNKRPNATFGPLLQPQPDWSSVTSEWDKAFFQWGRDPNSPFSNTIVSSSLAGDLYSLEIPDPSVVQGTIVEREGIVLGDQVQIFTTACAYPNIDCNDSCWIQLGAQDFANAPVRWQPAVKFTPSTMRKVDIRTTGSLLAWRVFSDGTTPFVLTGLDIDYVINGVR
jgi:hypothetical protein